MVTDCLGGGWDISEAEAVFITGTYLLMWILIPASICMVAWRIFVTNRRPAVLSLGLNESSAETAFHSCKKFWRPSILQATTAIVTFGIGLLTFRAYEFLEELIDTFAR
jgi:hypothetical protein